MPDVLTEATDVLLLLQVPPEVVSLNTALKPLQIVAVPLTVPAEGGVPTVSERVVYVTPQLPDTE